MVCNLKPKNLVGFKSHGIVLCAATSDDNGGECVKFVEPLEEVSIGEVILFQGLVPPAPQNALQV